MKKIVFSVTLTLISFSIVGVICTWAVPIMVITGQVKGNDGTLLEDTDVIIKNTNKETQSSQRTFTGNEAGTFDFTLIDFTNQSVADIGDQLEIIVKLDDGEIIARKIHILTEDEVESSLVIISVQVGGKPSISSIEPSTSTVNGGMTVTITGNSFQDGASVSIGENAMTEVNFVSETTLTAIVPVGTTGTTDLVVSNPDGRSATLSQSFTYTSLAPVVASINPTTGITTSGISTTINGENFQNGATVSFGNTKSKQVVFVSKTKLTADVPINEVGEVIIQVTNPDSQVSTQLVAFTYILPEPTISSLVPKSGQTTGGETIIIRGDNFQNGATISFGKIGGIDVSFVSRQEIAVISPKAEEAGLVNIIVKNPDDQSASIEFIYKEPKPQLIWDINQDKTVDIFDLVIVAGQFGKEGESLTGDIDKNDIVDIFDLVQIASHFGTTTESLAAPPIGDNRIAYLRNALTELKVWEKSDPDVIFATKLLRDWMVANGDIPMVAKLLPNYPNPFNPETWIPYQIADASTIKLSIFDVTGSQIRQIEVGYRQAGIYENQSDAIYWDGRNKFGEPVTSGVYFYMLQTDDFSATRKMIVLK